MNAAMFSRLFMAATMLVACTTDMEDDSSNGTLEQDSSVRYGVDYSWGRPSPATLRAQGYTFVSRYLSYDTTGKNISKAEAIALHAAGLDITLNWESSQTAPLAGYARGRSDASAALWEATSIGAPSTTPIYFSVDFDAQATQQGLIDAYFDGVASVIGRQRTGAYGGYYLIKRLFDHGKIAFGWQTYAWSYGHWDPRAQVRQIHNNILGGLADEDMAVVSDFGQWGNAPETGPEPAVPPAPTACGTIEPGHGLGPGQTWHSCDGRFVLAMQGDGNLVLYSGNAPVWASNTNTGAVAVMQGDGNLVVYSHHSHPVFASGTSGHSGAYLALQGDGNAVVYDGGGALWWTGTGGMPAPATQCGTLLPNEGLAIGTALTSCDGRYALAQQADGNLVLYHGSTAIWSTHTNGLSVRYSVMQGDGNFVLYNALGAPWHTHTNGHAGAWLAVQTDGNLVVYQGTTPIWASNTAGH